MLMKLERIYTVPLREAYEAVRYKRTPRAVKLLRAFMKRHMKADGERITISAALNDYLWMRSIKKPPRKVKVRLVKDAGFIRAYLADEKIIEPKKKPDDKKEEPKAAEKKADAAVEKKEAPRAQEARAAHKAGETKPAHAPHKEEKK
jgi:large subunit ribosomal protein L31e